MPLIETRALTVTYGERQALKPTDLTVAPGESLAVVGHNGSGKSSLLRALAGLEPSAGGEVILHAEACHHRRTTIEIAYVPQRSHARWDLPFTIGDVVAAGRPHRWWWQRPGRRDRDAVAAALAAVDLSNLAKRPVTELSGGQAQRVLLARALVQQPDIMILDEPLTGLDLTTAEAVMELLGAFTRAGGALVCALHEIDVARTSFTKTVALAQGTVLAGGVTAEVLSTEGVDHIFTRRATA
ncbi:metal ABC transporter ATP-binding protein [Mycobacterium sp. 155]|uniref:metal ABC transporter ATP-binding protein n=1 Tax=Mycobacterium sp. 155 TaxID=1157943 RepID=UPI00036E7045|nr:metal ABC transporter ATP-binding protein [Mycobacterium sp. 155]